MPREHVSDGCSPLNAPAPNLRALIQTPPKSHNPCAGVLSRIPLVNPHMAEPREGSYRMWGEHVGAVVDRGDGGPACRIAPAGGLFRSGGSRPGAWRLAVTGGMDERAHCGGVLRAGRQRAAL